ncbi:MAG: DUF6765 family protein [Pseudomonadota bacterium]
MQLDMHYYGTYAMARAAGMSKEAATVAATAAQFVDDNAHKQTAELKDGARIDSQATAHHAADIKNIDREDQRRVWVPFHFLPGNEGDSYTERLICRMDSPIAKQMVKSNIARASDSPFALELMGITAHVYADTFSHYGFSGISSRWNRVHNDSIKLHELEDDMYDYIKGKAKRHFKKNGDQGGLFENVKRWVVSFGGETLSGALGHGAVATYPDRPYLHWDFDYEHPDKHASNRNNYETFLIGCEKLHGMFADFLQQSPEHSDWDGVAFGDIKDKVSGVLEVQADKQGRINAWNAAAKAGDIYCGMKEEIPVYDPWHQEWSDICWLDDSSKVIDFKLYRYFQAASMHRNYVLRELLPLHGLVVQ